MVGLLVSYHAIGFKDDSEAQTSVTAQLWANSIANDHLLSKTLTALILLLKRIAF